MPEHLDTLLQTVSARGSATVYGLPGTGKTSLLVDLYSALVNGGLPPDDVLVLTPTREQANDLRARLGLATGRIRSGAIARTPHSLAFALLAARSVAADGQPVRFVSGADQDALLEQILDGHENMDPPGPSWPSEFTAEMRSSPNFRKELRDVLGRAMEWGLARADLEELAQFGRPAWRACAAILDEYEEITALFPGRSYDPASVLATGANLLSRGDFDFTDWRLPRVVLVENIQEYTEAAARLIDVLADGGASVVAFGSPDALTQGFRGVDGSLVREALAPQPRFSRNAAHADVHLRTARRHRGGIARAVRSMANVYGRYNVLEPDLMRAETGDEANLDVRFFDSELAQANAIARALRRAHWELDGGRQKPFSRMAVIARSAAALGTIRRALEDHGIPVGDRTPALPLNDHPASRELLLLLALAGRDRDEITDAQKDTIAATLLRSPYGGYDAIMLRKLKRDLARGRAGNSAHYVTEAVWDDDAVLPAGHSGLAAVRKMVRTACQPRSDSATEHLWQLWDAGAVAVQWQGEALDVRDQQRAGIAGDRLDAVMRLFALAEKLEAEKGALTPAGFAKEVESQSFAQDSLATRAASQDAVTLTTVAAAANQEWDLVIVPGVQEGQWPNPAVRGSLLGADEIPLALDRARGAEPVPEELSVAARAQAMKVARTQVIADESALFITAVSRARRQLLVTAVSSAQQAPSPFAQRLRELARPIEPASEQPRTDTADADRSEEYPLTLRGLVAQLRGLLAEELERPSTAASDSTRLTPVEELLAALASEGASGADPRTWPQLSTPTSADPIGDWTQPIPISPSALEKYQQCPLKWFLESHGGSAQSDSQSVGNLVHALAERHPRADAQELEELAAGAIADLQLDSGLDDALDRAKILAAARNLGKYQADHADLFEATETRVAVTIRSGVVPFRITGRIDRLERGMDQPETLRIIDFKTGKQRLSVDAAKEAPQLALYQLALLNGRLERDGDSISITDADQSVGLQTESAELVYVTPQREGETYQARKQPSFAGSTDAQRHWVDTAARAARGMAAAYFPPVKGNHCQRCALRHSCPAIQDGE